MKMIHPYYPLLLLAGIYCGLGFSPVKAELLADWTFNDQQPEAMIVSVVSNSLSLSPLGKQGPIVSKQAPSTPPSATKLIQSAEFNSKTKTALHSRGVVEEFNFPERQSFTIEGWFLLVSLPKDKERPHIVSNRSGAGNRNIGFSILIAPGKESGGSADLIFFVDGGDAASQRQLRAEGSITPNQWHHFAALRKADGQLHLYVDGNATPKAGVKFSSALTSDVRTTVGTLPNGDPVTYWNGCIAQLRFWNEAISMDQSLYQP